MKIISKIIKWHRNRNLIEGSTDNAQICKLLEEVTELYAASRPNIPSAQLAGELRGMITELEYKGRIKTDDGSGLADAIGDIVVVLVNICTRNTLSLLDCVKSSYKVIKDRKGEMRNGQYVKYEDFTEEEKLAYDKKTK